MLVICTLGDLLLDVIVRLDGPLAPGADTPADDRVGAGGQAANVAAWAAALGARGALRRQARRRRGRRARRERELERARRRARRPGRRRTTGVVVALVAPDGERTMASDRGVAPSCAPTSSTPPGSTAATWLHLSGYALLASRSREAALGRRGCARAAGARCRVDLSTWTRSALRTSASARALRRARARRRLRQRARARDARRASSRRRWVVKRGARGVVVDGGGSSRRCRRTSSTRPAPGDALAAGSSSAGSSSGSRRPPAASRSSERCRDDRAAPNPRRSARRSTTARPGRRARDDARRARLPAGRGVRSGGVAERRCATAGAVPATVGVIDGEILVGLDASELERFARRADARKVGPRDLAACVVQRRARRDDRRRHARRLPRGRDPVHGHGRPRRRPPRLRRRRPTSPPTSASSRARRRSSSPPGVKSLLDVPATAELLETLGVPVLGFRTDELPLFYARARRPAGLGARRRRRTRRRGSRARTGSSAARPPARAAAGRGLDDVEPLIERGARRGGGAGRPRPGGDAVRALVPPRAERRARRSR